MVVLLDHMTTLICSYIIQHLTIPTHYLLDTAITSSSINNIPSNTLDNSLWITQFVVSPEKPKKSNHWSDNNSVPCMYVDRSTLVLLSSDYHY